MNGIAWGLACLLMSQQYPVFEQELIDDQVSIGYGLAIGDVDGDGKADILLADKKAFVWYRNGDWKKFVLAENLTEYDNVCIAARDIDGDGKVEIAVGAQWNPNETKDVSRSGAVFYLVRPEDPTQQWTPIVLHHEPTVHRMRWVQTDAGRYCLVVVPLHGRGNQNGEGRGVNIIAYEKPDDPAAQPWPYQIIDQSLHLTHNLDVYGNNDREQVYVGGKEGVKIFNYNKGRWRSTWLMKNQPTSEIRVGQTKEGVPLLATIGPLHGNTVAVHVPRSGVPDLQTADRIVLDAGLQEGHARAVADFLGTGRDQVLAGWRSPDALGFIGIKLYIPFNPLWEAWTTRVVDLGDMACEDLTVADLNGDGKLDIIAAGRATHNLKIYWNRTGE